MVGVSALERRRADLGPPTVFEYSKQIWDGSEVFSGLVYSVITAPNGTLIATVIHYANEKWQKQQSPVYFLSHDDGHTWKGPRKYDESATVDDIVYTMNTSFVHDGEVFVVFRGRHVRHEPRGTADVVGFHRQRRPDPVFAPFGRIYLESPRAGGRYAGTFSLNGPSRKASISGS